MIKKYRQKTQNGLITLLILVILIPAAGCQAGSDLFNPDTYSAGGSEPWEKDIQQKPVKPKKSGDNF